jgi:hypothetical protein
MTGDLNAAESAFRAAQARPSLFGDDVQKNAVFQWAITREALYLKKPNIDNKKALQKAFDSYNRGFCQRSAAMDSLCGVIAEKIEQYGKPE